MDEDLFKDEENDMESRKLLNEVQDTLSTKHYSLRIEQTYIRWIRRFILFHNKRHANEMDESKITAS